MTPELVRAGLADSHAGVRRSAARLSEQFLGEDDLTGLKLAARINDPDAGVRLQVACSLGAWKDKWAGQGLAKLALNHPDDPYLTAATLSSVGTDNVAAVLGASTKAGLDQVPPRVVRPLLSMAVALGRRDALAHMLRDMAPPHRTKMATLAVILEEFNGHGTASPRDVDAATRNSIELIMREARAIASQPSATIQERQAAVSLLGNAPDDRRLLLDLLGPRQPGGIRSAAAAALARVPGDDAAAALFAGWGGYSPALKSQVLDLFLSRPGGTKTILDAIEGKALPAAQIDASHRQRLLKHKETAVRIRAAKLLASAINPDRQKVVDAYQVVLKLSGDTAHGKAIFAKTCSICHRLDKVGNEVGPDLAQIQNKSPAYLLIEVLDPNRNVDSRYVEYRATTKAGRSYSGLLHAESATSITLKRRKAASKFCSAPRSTNWKAPADR